MKMKTILFFLILASLLSCSSSKEEDQATKTTQTHRIEAVEQNGITLDGKTYKVRAITGLPRVFDVMRDANKELLVIQLPNRKILKFNERFEFTKWLGVNNKAELTDGWQPAADYTTQIFSPEHYAVPFSFFLDPRTPYEFGVVFFDNLMTKNANTLMKFDLNEGKFLGNFGLINPTEFSDGFNFDPKIPVGENYFRGTVVGTFDKNANLYVTDYDRCIIIKFDAQLDFQGWIGMKSNDVPTTGWTKTGTSKCSNKLGGFYKGYGTAFDSKGNLYVADTWNHRIQKFDSDGRFLGWIGAKADGSLTQGWQQSGESAVSTLAGGFNRPIAIRIDPQSDDLYVLEILGARLQKISKDGVPEWQLGGFKSPENFRWYDNEFMVADTGNNRVLIYSQN